jgi:hypothetical protein
VRRRGPFSTQSSAADRWIKPFHEPKANFQWFQNKAHIVQGVLRLRARRTVHVRAISDVQIRRSSSVLDKSSFARARSP